VPAQAGAGVAVPELQSERLGEVEMAQLATLEFAIAELHREVAARARGHTT
jgi:hypothetical protein